MGRLRHAILRMRPRSGRWHSPPFHLLAAADHDANRDRQPPQRARALLFGHSRSAIISREIRALRSRLIVRDYL